MYTQESSVHDANTTPIERVRPFDGLFTAPAVSRPSGKPPADYTDPFADVEGGLGMRAEYVSSGPVRRGLVNPFA